MNGHTGSAKQTALLPLNEFVEQVADQWRLVHPQSLLCGYPPAHPVSQTRRLSALKNRWLWLSTISSTMQKSVPKSRQLSLRMGIRPVSLHIADRGPGLTRELQHALAFRPSPLTGNESFPNKRLGNWSATRQYNHRISWRAGALRRPGRQGCRRDDSTSPSNASGLIPHARKEKPTQNVAGGR